MDDLVSGKPKKAGPPQRRTGWVSSLSNRNIRRFIIGESLSAIGSAMSPVAIAFAVLGAFGSASNLGYVLAAGTIPLVAFLLIGGTLADGMGPRRAMLSADALRAIAQLLLGLWVLVGHPSLVGVMVLQALVGFGTGLFMPASTALVPAISDREALQQANALRHLATSFGALVGPALAGIIVATSGPGWAIALDGLSYAASVGFLASLRPQKKPVVLEESFTARLRTGWTEFWSRTWLWALVGQAGVLGLTAWPAFYVLGAVVAKESLGGAAPWGLILSAMGAGTIVGGVVSLTLRPKRPLLAVALFPSTWVLILLALAFGAPVPLLAVLTFINGTLAAVNMSLYDTTLQTEIPASALSRVSSYDLTTTFALLPVGYAIIGIAAALLGIRQTFLAATTLVLLAMIGMVLLPSIRAVRPTASEARSND